MRCVSSGTPPRGSILPIEETGRARVGGHPKAIGRNLGDGPALMTFQHTVAHRGKRPAKSSVGETFQIAPESRATRKLVLGTISKLVAIATRLAGTRRNAVSLTMGLPDRDAASAKLDPIASSGQVSDVR